jgi:putative Ca2+/H+ antiporter (TMEM165/GDT1 family)
VEALLLSTGVVALAEIGDKTQLLSLVRAARFEQWLPISLAILVATVARAAELDALAAVVAGTTLGMLLASVPVVVLGQKFASRLPVRAVQVVAAVMFAAPGVLTLPGFAI